jgi:hypothetical protein
MNPDIVCRVRKAKTPHLIGLRSEATARRALTLSPPIRVNTLT